MRTFLIILLSVIGFCCKTNHYLSEPIKSIPNIRLQTNLKSNGILVATDSNLKIDTFYFENCLKGLKLNLKQESEIRITDEIYFVKCPNTAILTELKVKYNVVGLLLLTKLSVEKKSFDVASGKFQYMDNRMPEPYYKVYKISIPRTNLNVQIISQWEYHDFDTGRSYKFKVSNDKVFELEQQVKDIDSFIEENYELLDPMFYQNGSITAHLICREN